MLVPLQRMKLYEEIVDQLIDRIIKRQLVPGEKLPTERELAETLKVNRATVREALSKLESMELVEIRHGSGVFIRDYLRSGSFELIQRLMIKKGVPDLALLKNLADLRRHLLPEIASLAARNRTESDIAELEQLIYNNSELPISDKDSRVLNFIARASGNLVFVILQNSFSNPLQQYAFIYFDNDENKTRSEAFHREILDAIRNRDEENARKIMLKIMTFAEEATFNAIKAGFTTLSDKEQDQS